MEKHAYFIPETEYIINDLRGAHTAKHRFLQVILFADTGIIERVLKYNYEKARLFKPYFNRQTIYKAYKKGEQIYHEA